MGEITIYFVGICTFMQDVEGRAPGFSRRVVLVNARVPQVINETAIPPHIPTLRMAAGDLEVNGVSPATTGNCVLEWELHGCKIDIANAIGNLTHDESFECCVPHLTVLTPDLGGPSPKVVLGAEAEQASCYFDVTAGELSAGLIAEGAAVSVLKVRTVGDSPVLRVQRFRTEDPQEFRLRSGSQIAIMNVGREGIAGDDTTDFLLHYNVAENIPDNAAVPSTPATCCRPLAPSYILAGRQIGVGPGCSNASFP